MPLLLSQLNSALIWGCLGAYRVGWFNYEINRTQIMEGSFISLRNWTIDTFLENLVLMEPLNIFFYTWVLLRELELDSQNTFVKRCFKWFRLVSIFLVPLAFLSIVPAYLMEISLYGYSKKHGNFKKAEHHQNISSSLAKTVAILCVLTNVVSSLILLLVVRLIFKLRRQAVVSNGAFDAKV